MAVKMLSDGRWAIYYHLAGKKKWEYFGRGELARFKAEKRDEQIREERGKIKAEVRGSNPLISTKEKQRLRCFSPEPFDFMLLTFGENFRKVQMPKVPRFRHGLLFSTDITSAEMPSGYSGVMPTMLHAAIGAHPIRILPGSHGLPGTM